MLDFMQILLMDSLLNVSASTSPHPMVLLLEVRLIQPLFIQITLKCNQLSIAFPVFISLQTAIT